MLLIKTFFKTISNFRFKKEFLGKLILLLISLSILFIINIIFLTHYLPGLSICFSKSLIACLSILCFLCILFITLKVFFTIVKVDQSFYAFESKHSSSYSNTKPTTFCTSIDYFISNFEMLILEEYSAKLLQKQAELKAMQSQINPHFLYNTLDSIRGQALEENCTDIAETIEALSKLFRYSISNSNTMPTLQEEIKNIDMYIQIQKYRFGDRFELIKDIALDDLNILNYKIPKLTLQPIVENAIQHGLDSIANDGQIIIKVFTTQYRLIIDIMDNGIGMDTTSLNRLNEILWNPNISVDQSTESKGTGIALINVNARIKLTFGKDYGLNAYSLKNVGTKIQITLPIVEDL